MKKGLLQILALLISAWPCISQPQALHSLWFHTLSVRQGLSQNFNWYVYHDSRGFVWISSVSGLNRFDGLEVKQYHSVQNDTTSLSDENVYSDFFEDGRNDIWFSTLSAVHCYIRKHDHFRHYPLRDANGKKIPGEYKVQFLERDSFLWVTTGTALYRMNIWQPNEPVEKILETAQFKCLMEVDASGAVRAIYAFGMVKGLEICTVQASGATGKRAVPGVRKVLFPNELIREVHPDRPDRFWLISDESGLFSFDPTAPHPGFAKGMFPGAVVSFVPWADHYLLVAVRGKGIILLNKDTGVARQIATRFIGRDESATQSFRGLYLDRDDNLWVTDESSGLYFANLHKTKFFTIPKFVAPHTNDKYSYWAIEEDLNGNIWIGTSPGGVFLLNKNKELVRHFVHRPGNPNSLPSNWVRDILVDKNNHIYIATSEGLVWFDQQNDRFRTIPAKDGVKGILVNHLHLTNNGRILASTERNGIFAIEQHETRKQMEQWLPASSGGYQTIFGGQDGKVYCARNLEEVCVFECNNDRLQLLGSLPVSGLINGFYDDSTNGWLYFATSNGLVRFAPSQPALAPRFYTEEQGLPGKFIGELLTDDRHNLWLGTNNGLALFDRKRDSIRTFTLADGAQSPDFHLTAALKSREGSLWFGGSGGITVVPANGAFAHVETPPRVMITGILINDSKPDSLYCAQTGATNISQIRHLERPYEDNTISFEFVAIEYSDPANNRLRYRLEGKDDHWVGIEKGKPGFARYPKLPHGYYTFWLQAANSDGIWSQPVQVMLITINPPWYLTWWFKTLFAATILGLFYAFYRHRVARIRREEEILRKEAEFKQKEAEFRQREAEAKQQMAETETAILRLQMNPHFIFNSMNSINAYILKNDIDTASDYLGRFAALMRMILNLAAKPFIPISDEIKLLDQYLQTEAMRFEKKFSYSFEVDESIDKDEMIVPTMILQPFVENAIWHGLVNKKGKGHITIRFKQQDSELTCSVEDNGIGREAARLLKNGKAVQDSKALSITERRLKLLEEETGSPAGYEIIDLKNAEGQAEGTKILLHLPLL